MSNVRLSSDLDVKLRQTAAQKGTTKAEIIRRALEEYCDRELAMPSQSRYDDMIGIVEGPSDSSRRVSEVFTEIMCEKYG